MKIEALESAFSSNPENINAAHALIEALRAECERKDAALRWYADSSKPGEFKIVDREGGFISDLSTWGERARSALASTGEG